MNIDRESSLMLATANNGKFNEFSELLSELNLNILKQPKDFFVEENGKTFKENARIKALALAKKTGHLTLSDDSGLSVFSLGGEPGIHSSRYASNDEERIRKLLNVLEPFSNRDAKFVSALCVAINEKVLIEVEAYCEGVIMDIPHGKYGFGYDPIFKVKEIGLTFAEMSRDEKLFFGHRGKAFNLLKPQLIKILDLH